MCAHVHAELRPNGSALIPALWGRTVWGWGPADPVKLYPRLLYNHSSYYTSCISWLSKLNVRSSADGLLTQTLLTAVVISATPAETVQRSDVCCLSVSALICIFLLLQAETCEWVRSVSDVILDVLSRIFKKLKWRLLLCSALLRCSHHQLLSYPEFICAIYMLSPAHWHHFLSESASSQWL